ncbi:hypothetical protein Tco_0301096 [Tanacetum coccineum]
MNLKCVTTERELTFGFRLSSSALEMLVPGHAVGNVMGRGRANVDNIHKMNILHFFMISEASVEISDNKSSCGDRYDQDYFPGKRKRGKDYKEGMLRGTEVTLKGLKRKDVQLLRKFGIQFKGGFKNASNANRPKSKSSVGEASTAAAAPKLLVKRIDLMLPVVISYVNAAIDTTGIGFTKRSLGPGCIFTLTAIPWEVWLISERSHCCERHGLVDFNAPKYSSLTKEVPQGKKPRARSGLRRKQSSKHTSESTTEASKSQSVHSNKEIKSSSAMDTSSSHPSPPTPMVGEMHKEGMDEGTKKYSFTHILAGSNPSVLVVKTKSTGDGLKTAHTTSSANEESGADDISQKVKLEDLADILKDTISAFFTYDSLINEPNIISDVSEEEENAKNDKDNEDTLVPPPSPKSALI